MSGEERKREIARLRAKYARELSTPLMSEGSISPMQVGLMSSGARARYTRDAQIRMSVESRIRLLARSDEQIAAAEAAWLVRENASKEAQLRRHLEDVQRMGVSKKTGRMRPSWQREIDSINEQLRALGCES